MKKSYAQIWDKKENCFGPPSQDILKYIPLKLNLNIIDVGSGNGRYALYLANYGYTNVTALEISTQGCDRIIESNKKIKIRCEDVLLSEVDFKYDVVLSSGLLEEFETESDQIDCISKMQKMVTRGGVLVLRYCLFISNRNPEKRVRIDLVGALFKDVNSWEIIFFSTDAKPFQNNKSSINDGQNLIQRQTIVVRKI